MATEHKMTAAETEAAHAKAASSGMSSQPQPSQPQAPKPPLLLVTGSGGDLPAMRQRLSDEKGMTIETVQAMNDQSVVDALNKIDSDVKVQKATADAEMAKGKEYMKTGGPTATLPVAPPTVGDSGYNRMARSDAAHKVKEENKVA